MGFSRHFPSPAGSHEVVMMDTTAQRARDREAFREFLEKHRYAPQGRHARAGNLEEKDLDALMRGSLAPVWAWAWRNVKNAEDMEIVRRNVQVARHSIDSCKQERDQARVKREALLRRKKELHEALTKARDREQALLGSLRGVEHEQYELIQSAEDTKQREVLRKAFNAKNDDAVVKLSKMLNEAQRVVTVDGEALQRGVQENQIEILLSEFKRMVKSTESSEGVDFGDSDIAHLRDFSGSELQKWLLELASRPHEDTPDDEEEAKYAAHVEEHSSTSHDALVQIQSLLRQSQAEHIASFVQTQKTYAKAQELKQRIDQAMAPDDAQCEFWGSENGGGHDVNGRNASKDLAVETVDLQIKSQVNAVALNYATRAYADVSKQVESHRQQKQELDHKVELMNRFDERQEEIVTKIRAKYRQNQELLQSLTRKQSRLLQVVAEETRPRVEKDTDAQVTAWRKLVLDELRVFSSLRLASLDSARKQVAFSQDVRQAEKTVPFEDFYIRQVQDASGQQNGYRRLARALGLPEYSNWVSILAALARDAGDNAMTAEEASQALSQLEIDVNEDRRLVVPGAQALLGQLKELRDNMTHASYSRLEDVAHTNSETKQQQIPELDLVIENWYHQPAWTALLEEPRSQPPGTRPVASAMEMEDLLR